MGAISCKRLLARDSKEAGEPVGSSDREIAALLLSTLRG
jgi:hypothetical protein